MAGNNPLLAAEITAEFQGFKKGFDESVKIAQQGSAAISGSLSNIDRSFKVVNSTKFTFGQNFRTQAAMITPAVKSVAAGANQAGFALTNLGRVAQDLPFGFIGIQNNLNPLLESFQQLRKESGSNSAALKALGQSLIGPAGIGIALSVVSAGILLYQQYQQKANKVTKEAKDDTEDYIKSLDQLTQARLKGAQNAQKELTDLQTLYAVATNTTIALNKRKEAVDELQDKYPKYFANLKDEIILNGQAKTAYDSLAQSIIATARARAAQDLITQNVSRQLTNEQKNADLEIKLTKEKIIEEKALAQIRAGGTGLGAVGYAKIAEASANRQKEIIKQQNDLKTDSNILTQRNLKLTKDIVQEVKDGADLTGANNEKLKEVEDTYKRIYSLRNLGAGGGEVKIGTTPPPISPNFDTKTLEFLTMYERLTREATASTVRFEESIQELANNAIGDTLGNAFSQIGVALAEGTSAIDAFGNALLDAFAGFLSQLGQMFIKEGIAQIGYGIAKNLILPGSGAGNIAGGIGMIAAGGLISAGAGAIGARGNSSGSSNSYTKNVPRFASGVNNFAGGLAMVGENGPEFVNLPTGADVIPNGRSMDLIGKNQNVNVVLGGEITADYRGLSIGLKRYNELTGRTT